MIPFLFKHYGKLRELNINIRSTKIDVSSISSAFTEIQIPKMLIKLTIQIQDDVDNNEFISALIEKCSSNLRILYLKTNDKFEKGLEGIIGSKSIRILKLYHISKHGLKLNKCGMGIIESLPNLEEIYGFYPADQTDDTFLDYFFASCGHSLKKIHIKITGEYLPRALLK